MKCHYLEEFGYVKVCKAKGNAPPTISELRVHCFRSAYDCPVYKSYMERMVPKAPVIKPIPVKPSPDDKKKFYI